MFMFVQMFLSFRGMESAYIMVIPKGNLRLVCPFSVMLMYVSMNVLMGLMMCMKMTIHFNVLHLASYIIKYRGTTFAVTVHPSAGRASPDRSLAR